MLRDCMRIVAVMDPVSTVVPDEDTSFAIIREAIARGHSAYHVLDCDVALSGNTVTAFARPISIPQEFLSRGRQATPSAIPPATVLPMTLGAPEPLLLREVDAVFIRKDPPFDAAYWWLTLLLEHVRDQTLIVNDPRGLRDANEKLYACHFPSVMPRTLVDSDRARIRAFVQHIGGQAVIKPIDGHGGEGVFQLFLSDPNVNGLIEAVTQQGRSLAMVQEYIPEVREGDKRILLMDGDPLGAILRVPQGGDVRSNIHVGGSVVATEINDADQRIIDEVAPRLREDGLYFVGLDIIGGKLTEVNVTSPTGIQQMSRLGGQNCEAKVIDWLEARAAANPA